MQIGNRNLSKDKIYTLLDHFQDGIFAVELGLIVYANKKLQEMIDYPIEEIINHPFTKFIHEDDRAMVLQNYELRRSGEKAVEEYEFRLLSKKGKITDVRIRLGMRESETDLSLSMGTLHDITERKRTMQALAQSKHDIQSILENMPDVFYRTDAAGMITMISPSCKEALGYEVHEMIGKPMAQFYCQKSDREKVLKALHDGNGKATQAQTCLQHKNGSLKWVSTNAYIRIDDAGTPLGVEGIARDITKTKQLEEQLKNFAQIDDLTQLYNRRHFMHESQKLIEIAKRYQRPISVLMLDLDSFKCINDSYGHHVGDEVLRHFSNCCRKIMRQTDIMGRLGGEEFAILSPETTLEAAVSQAVRIRDSINLCGDIHIDGKAVRYTVSIGVAIVCSDSSPNIEYLLMHADKALYKAKEQRNHIEAIEC